MPTAEKQKVLNAVKDLKLRVTVADVATKTGLPLLVANQELNTIAAETGGHLQVSTTGDIAYKFDRGFETRYATKGLQRSVEMAVKKLLEVGYFLLRISFGVMLIVSLITVVVLILILLKSQSRDDRDRGFDFDFFDYILIRDLFWWGTYSNAGGGYGEPYRRKNERNKGNFLFNCFSFLFGDGNPNLHLEERKWELIAQVIKANDGVVTSEQLAPYTGHDPKNEDGVLPVLVRFNGRPEVSDRGNILYSFPEMQVTATEETRGGLPAFLREWPYQFTSVPAESLVPVWILAGVNFFGAWFLQMQVLHSYALHPLAGLVGIITVYGSLFVAVPMIRWFVIQMLNTRIESRNGKRTAYAHLFEHPSAELKQKLIEAKEQKIKVERVDAEKIVYTTEKDALEQEFEEKGFDASP
jgi:hypothetical protein